MSTFLFKLIISLLVTTNEKYIDVNIPILSVIANPFIGPFPMENSIIPINSEVIFESNILVNAFLNPFSIIISFVIFFFFSSFIISNINKFASTAMPIVKTIQEIPGNVIVAFIIDIIDIIKSIFIIKVMFVIIPNLLYKIYINIIIDKIDIIIDINPF